MATVFVVGGLLRRALFSSVQSLSRVWLSATPWTAARQASLSITNARSPPKPMSIESVMPSNHLILYHPLLCLPSIFPSIRAFFQWVRSSHQLARNRSFSFNISPSNEHPGLISFRIDWLDLRALPQSCPFISSLRVNTILNMCLSCSFSFSFTTYKCIPQIAFVFWVSYELYHVLY